MAQATMTKDDVKGKAIAFGADLVGVVSARQFESMVPSMQKPSRISDDMESIVVMAKHLYSGSVKALDVSIQRRNSQLIMSALDRISVYLAEWLEKEGQLAIPIPIQYTDYDLKKGTQGPLDLRNLAVQAGLGTLGLNLMLLTEKFGPRAYIAAVMTSAALEPDEPMREELCPGIKCGRCTAICPASAIPRQAGESDQLDQYRSLDKRSCATNAQPFGLGAILRKLAQLASMNEADAAAEIAASPQIKAMWQAVSLRTGSYGGCFECFHVCPIGEDYAGIKSSPHRKADLPGGSYRVERRDGKLSLVTAE